MDETRRTLKTVWVALLLLVCGPVGAQEHVDYIPWIPPASWSAELFLEMSYGKPNNAAPDTASVRITVRDDCRELVARRMLDIAHGHQRIITTSFLLDGTGFVGHSWAIAGFPPGVEVNAYLRDKVSRFIGPTAGVATPRWHETDGAWIAGLAWANPARNQVNASRLRLFNTAPGTRYLAIGGWDRHGDLAPPALCRVEGGNAVMIDIGELESGSFSAGNSHACSIEEGWGAGTGKWQVLVFDYRGSNDEVPVSPLPFVAMSILHSREAGM